MKRWILLLAFLWAVPAAAQVAVSGNVQDVGVANVGSGMEVTFELQNYGGEIPRIPGGPTIGRVLKSFKTDTAGNFTGSLYPNTVILPIGTWYRVCVVDRGLTLRCGNYLISGTFNLANATPLIVVPHAGPNQLVLGSFPFTQLTPATTWAITHNFNDPNTLVFAADTNGNLLFPDTTNCRTNPNVCTLTFVPAKAGFAVAFHAGAINIATNQPNAITSNSTSPQAINAQPFTVQGAFTANAPCNFGGALYLGVGCFVGTDIGAQVNSAIASLPSIGGYKAGTIHLLPGQFTQTTKVTIASPLVSIIGAGRQSTQITCSLNTDCWEVRTSAATISMGQRIGGFSLTGPGSGNDNANGIHTGDLIGAKFYDLNVSNFIGVNSSCFWIDNQNLWFEQNTIEGAEFGEKPDGTKPGCTKHIRMTNSGGVNQVSASYNHWVGVHVTGAGSQIIFSDEGLLLWGNFVDIKGNISPLDTGISIPASNAQNNAHNLFAFNFECTSCVGGGSVATGVSMGAGTNLAYTGSLSESNFVSDSLNATATLTYDVAETTGNPASAKAAAIIRTGAAPSGWFNISSNIGANNPPASGSGLFAAYNFTNGGGEFAFVNNKGAGSIGGFNFYDWNGATAAFIGGFIPGTGLKFNPALLSPSSNAASSGQLRLASGDSACWRNNANNADLCLSKTAGDALQYANVTLSRIIASGTSTLGNSSIAATSCNAAVTTSAVGAATTDVVSWSYASAPSGTTDAKLTLSPYSTADNVNFILCNPTAGALVPTGLVVNWSVRR